MSFLSTLIDTPVQGRFYQHSDSVSHSIFMISPTQASIANSTTHYTRIYNGHKLSPTHAKELPRNNISPDWFLPSIIIVLIVYTWIRIFYSKYFSQMVQAFLNNNLANQIVRDENIFIQRASIYLSIVFNLIAAMLLYQVSIHYRWPVAGMSWGFDRFIFFFVLVSAGYAIKFLVLKICGWLFEQEREMATYIFNVFLVNNVLGMALLPFICIITYNELINFSLFVTITLILVITGFAWRIFRGIQIGWSAAVFSPLYLFLYLCTLEIAPLIILMRIVT